MLILVIGCVAVLALLVAVTVDAARLYLARRALDGVTDAAALAAVQAVDLDAVYAGGVTTRLPVDEAGARRAVRRYLDASDAADDLDGLTVVAIEVGPDEVTVRTRAVVRLPFVGPATRGRSTVVVTSAVTAVNHAVEP